MKTHDITAAELAAVLARLTVREDEERAAQHEYTVCRGLPRCLWVERPHA